MDIITDSHQVSRLEVVDTGRRRRWTDAEKLRIIEESYAGPRQASATARRHGIIVQQLFAWRKAWREGRLGTERQAGFVPAVIVADRPPPSGPPVADGRMEVISASGRRVIVDADFDARALSQLLDVLEHRPVLPGAGGPVRRSTECAGG